MGKVLVTEQHLQDIASAIRAKLDSQDTYRPGDMAAAIGEISGYPEPAGTVTITQNGMANVKDYAAAAVSVQPNLQQKTAAQNGTVTPDSGYDGLSSVVVNVSDSSEYIFTLHSRYTPNGLTSSGWTDDTGNYSFTLRGGNWIVENSSLKANGAMYTVPCPAGYFLAILKCSIASGFTPINSTNWYEQSCLFGRELTEEKNDWGCTMYGGLIPCIGYGFGSYASSGVALTPETEHEIALLHDYNRNILWIDGILVKTVTYTAKSGNFDYLGIFYNGNAPTAVKGSISKLGIWTFTRNNTPIVGLPEL